MSREYLYMMEDVLETGVAFGSIGPVLSLIAYVFSSMALYTIAQRRELRKPWLAWIPVVNVWILGSLSDQYRYVVRGEVKSKRKILLAISILNSILSMVAAVRILAAVFSVFSATMQGMSPDALGRMLLSGVMNGLLFFIPALIFGIVGLVFEIMALYDVYTSCDPANNVIYTILSLIPGVDQVTRPLFLFLCRNQDGGMPPRRYDPVSGMDSDDAPSFAEVPPEEF